MSWTRVKRDAPCGFCGGTSWCAFTDDGERALCMRTPRGGRPLPTGGRLFQLRDRSPRIRVRPQRNASPLPDHGRKWRERFERTPTHFYIDWGQELGVEPTALLRLGAFESKQHPRSILLPVRRFGGQVVGIQVRDRRGRRFCTPTGQCRAGAFVPDSLASDDAVCLAEGATTTSALLSVGLEAIGFWSANVTAHVMPFVRGREVVVVSDQDAVGRAATASLVQQVQVEGANSVRIVAPPPGLGDLRDWVRGGATKADILARATTPWGIEL